MAAKKGRILQEIASVQELASMFLISERQVQRLTAQGVLRLAADGKGQRIRGRYVLADAVSRYVKHLREASADKPQQRLYEDARTRRITAEAEIAEQRAQQIKGQLYHAADIEFAITAMITYLRQGMLAIPASASRKLIGKKTFKEVHEPLMEEIVGVLNRLSKPDREMMLQLSAARLAAQGVHLAKPSVEATHG